MHSLFSKAHIYHATKTVIHFDEILYPQNDKPCEVLLWLLNMKR